MKSLCMQFRMNAKILTGKRLPERDFTKLQNRLSTDHRCILLQCMHLHFYFSSLQEIGGIIILRTYTYCMTLHIILALYGSYALIVIQLY